MNAIITEEMLTRIISEEVMRYQQQAQQPPRTPQNNILRNIPTKAQSDEDMKRSLEHNIDRLIGDGTYQNDTLCIDTFNQQGLPFEYMPDNQTVRFKIKDFLVPFPLYDFSGDTRLMADAIYEFYRAYKRTVDSTTNTPLATYFASNRPSRAHKKGQPVIANQSQPNTPGWYK